MAESNKISADLREKFGKGAARKLRVLGKIPAVIYGHGTDPVHTPSACCCARRTRSSSSTSMARPT
jgi:hypothetical protein